MTILEWEAESLEFAAKMYAKFLTTTPSDKLEWTPDVEGSKARTIDDFTHECIRVNKSIAIRLEGGTPESNDDKPAPFASTEEAAEAMKASAKELADVMRSSDPSVLGKTIPVPWGEVKGAFLVALASRHVMYHGGQINYIQAVHGDGEFHFPD